jgi:hypothetical protein
MHQAAIIGHTIEDAESFGWDVKKPATPEWSKLVEGVQVRALAARSSNIHALPHNFKTCV